MTLTPEIDTFACVAHGDCAVIAPNAFRVDDIAVVTDWRGQLRANQKNVLIGAAVAGFVLGGGIAAVGGLFRRRR